MAPANLPQGRRPSLQETAGVPSPSEDDVIHDLCHLDQPAPPEELIKASFIRRGSRFIAASRFRAEDLVGWGS